MMAVRAGLVMVMVLASVTAGWAQTSLGVHGYVTFGAVALGAADTFTAIAGKRQAPSVGVGGQTSGIWKGLFVDASYARQSLDGQRVFLSNGTVYPLGIPVRIRFEPIDVAAGWRLGVGRLVPYAGIGLTSIRYTETSDFAQAGEDVDARKSGALVLAGVDVPVGRWLLAGGEVRFRRVTGVLGAAGASAVYGEDELGGVSYAVRVSVGR